MTGRPPVRRPRRWLLVLGPIVAAAGLIVAVVATNLGGDQDPRSGSVALPPGPALTLTRVPASYRITYRVDTANVTTTQRLSVRRPFDSLDQTFSGPPPGGPLVQEQVTTFGKLSLNSPGGQATILVSPPTLAGTDQRLDFALTDAIRAGLIARGELRRVAGRVCQMFRVSSISSFLTATVVGGDQSELCVDEAGLVLEQLLEGNGRVLQRRVATAVEENLSLGDDLFAITGATSVPVDKGGGSIRPVDPASRPPGVFYELSPTVEGFARRGRYSVIPPQQATLSDPATRNSVLAGVSDVFVRGLDVIVIDQGGTLGGVQPFPLSPSATTVDLGEAGKASVQIAFRGTELRVALPGGHYIRVLGTASLDDLIAVGRHLHPVAGNELRYIGG